MMGRVSVRTIILGLIKVNASYYSFLSGVLIAVSVGLYIAVYSSDEIPARSGTMLLSSLLTLISSFCWIYISWKLEAIQRLVMFQTPRAVQSEDVYRTLVAGKELLFGMFFLTALSSAGLGLGILVLGHGTQNLVVSPVG